MAGKQGYMSDGSRTGNGSRRFDVRDEEHRSSDEIKEDIGRTRTEMDCTLERLGEQLKPRRLFESFLHAMGSSGDGGNVGDYAQIAGTLGKRALRQAERHPIPALLFGAGLAWLIYEEFGRKDDVDDRDYDREFDRAYERYENWYGDDVRDVGYASAEYAMANRERRDQRRPQRREPGVAEKIGEKVSDAAGSVKETAKETAETIACKAKEAGEKTAEMVSDAVSGVSHAVSEAGHTARSAGRAAGRAVGRAGRRSAQSTARGVRTASLQTRRMARGAAHRAEDFGVAVGHQAQRAYEQGREGFTHAVNDYPLAVGAGFAAIGVLAGLALPSTQCEDEWMGEKSDRLKDMARQKGEEVLERGRQTVETAAATLKSEAKAEGLMPGSLQEKAKHVISEAVGAAKEAVKHEMSAEGIKEKALNVAVRVGEEVQAEATRHKDEMLGAATEEKNLALPEAKPSASDQCSTF